MPDVLDRVQFRTVGGQGQQGEVVGDNEGVRSVPACAVEDEDGMGTGGDAAGDFREVGVHRLGVDGRQDQPCRGATCGADGPEDVGPLVAGIAGCAGSGAAPGPDAGERALLANARVRHGPRTGGGTMANS